MISLALVLLFQSLTLPSRSAIENPATVSPIPDKLKKDYDKAWTRFTAGNEDGRLLKDLNKILQKQKGFEAGRVVTAYLSLYMGDAKAAQENFSEALVINPDNR